MNKLISIIILVFAATILFAAGESEIQSPGIIRGITIIDSYNRSVTIEKPARRVVSTAPNVTETIFALGKGELLVGRTDFCDYPEEALNITSIGSLMEPDIEAIAELSPDIVIASTHFTKESMEKLTNLSIPVVILTNEDSFEGSYRTIEDISRILGAEKEGNKLINNMKATLDKVMEAVSGKEKPSVYYVIGFGEYGDFTAGGDTFISQIIEMAGGDNIAKDIEGWSFSLEAIIESDPDILICSKFWNTKELLEITNGYKSLRSVKNGQLYEIDNNMMDRLGPRLAEGLKALAEIIHPDAF